MIDAGAQIGNPRVTFTALPEPHVLDHRQALIVVHGDEDIDAAREELRREGRIGGNGSVQVEPFRPQLPDHGLDHVDFLAAQSVPTRPHAD